VLVTCHMQKDFHLRILGQRTPGNGVSHLPGVRITVFLQHFAIQRGQVSGVFFFQERRGYSGSVAILLHLLTSSRGPAHRTLPSCFWFLPTRRGRYLSIQLARSIEGPI